MTDNVDVRVVRSNGRVKTVSIRQKDGYLEVRAPAGMQDDALQPIIARLRARLDKTTTRKALDAGELQRRAAALNATYFEGRLVWSSIDWVSNQDRRWGSCTPATGAIRLSHRLAVLPTFVLDYVIVHELAHLVEANHGARFWRLVNRYPRTERARGYLMGVDGTEQEGEM